MTFCPPRRLATRIAAVAFSVGAAGVGVMPATAFAQSDDGDGPRNPPSKEEIEAKRTCMAEHGIDLPEPKLDENGRPQRPPMRPGNRPELTDEQRAAFREAAEACGLPRRPGGFGPGGHRRPQLTDEQKACLEEQGIKKPEKPADGERPEPTDEQRAAFRTAAEACGIPVPKELTDDQKACLEEQGVQKPERPANGERRARPTAEQRDAFRKAAEACGIELPDKPPGDDAPADNSTESTSTTASS